MERLGDEFGGWCLLFEVLASYLVEKARKQLERNQNTDESHLQGWMNATGER